MYRRRQGYRVPTWRFRHYSFPPDNVEDGDFPVVPDSPLLEPEVQVYGIAWPASASEQGLSLLWRQADPENLITAIACPNLALAPSLQKSASHDPTDLVPQDSFRAVLHCEDLTARMSIKRTPSCHQLAARDSLRSVPFPEGRRQNAAYIWRRVACGGLMWWAGLVLIGGKSSLCSSETIRLGDAEAAWGR